jgi:hypothetical protein
VLGTRDGAQDILQNEGKHDVEGQGLRVTPGCLPTVKSIIDNMDTSSSVGLCAFSSERRTWHGFKTSESMFEMNCSIEFELIS